MGQFKTVWDNLGGFVTASGILDQFRTVDTVWKSWHISGKVRRVWDSLRTFETVCDSLGQFGTVWYRLRRLG